MTKNRIRELRKELDLTQEGLSKLIGTTQQAISKMENGSYAIPSDLLIELSKFFNVTADYIIGLSDIKRDSPCQTRANQEIDSHYNIVIRYKNLNETNKKTLLTLLKRLEQTQIE